MKKFLTVLGCIFAFAILVMLCYFFVNPKDNRVFEGKYYLYQTIQTDYTDADNQIENRNEVIIDENSYLELDKEKNFYAHNINEISFEENVTYNFTIVGTELKIKLNGKTIYEGYYANDEIVIIINDEDNKIAMEYYYKKI